MSTQRIRPPPPPGLPPATLTEAVKAVGHNRTQKVRESPADSSETISMDELIQQRDELRNQIHKDDSITLSYKNTLLVKSSSELNGLILNKESETEEYFENEKTLGPRGDTLLGELRLLKKIYNLKIMEENIERLERKAIELYENTAQELTPKQKPLGVQEKTGQSTVFVFSDDEQHPSVGIENTQSELLPKEKDRLIIEIKKDIDDRTTSASKTYGNNRLHLLQTGILNLKPGWKPEWKPEWKPAGGNRKTQRKRRKEKKTRKQRKGKTARKNKTMRR